MLDSAVARRHMVDGQIRTADVTNPSLVTAMLTVPRELFVTPALASQAYRDGDVPLGQGRFLLRPMAPICGRGSMCSMSVAAPVTPLRYWRIWALRSWRSRKTPVWPALLSRRLPPPGPHRPWSLPVPGPRLAGGGAIRPDLFQWRDRNHAGCARPPAQAQRAARRCFWARAGNEGYDLSANRGKACWPAYFRCRSAGAAGFCRASGLCLLTFKSVGRSALLQAQSNYVTSQANYRRVIGVNPGNLAPGTPVDRFSPSVLARAITEGETQNPSVLAAMYGVDIAELAVTISEGALYPNLGLTASAQKQWDPLFNINKETNISVLGTLTVPIYQGGSEYATIRQSKETLGQQRLNLDVNRDQARPTVVQSWGQ